MAATTITPRRTAAPTVPAGQAWSAVAQWLAMAAGFVVHVWVVAPARKAWSVPRVRTAAWCALLPLLWRIASQLVYVIARFVFGPLLALAWIHFRAAARMRDSRARTVLSALGKARRGYRRGRRSGARVAALVYR